MFDLLLLGDLFGYYYELPKTTIEGNVKLLVDVRFKSDFEEEN